MSEEPRRERVIAGRYRLLSPLGEGGMGTVWRARDELLHREVAVKEVRAPSGLSAADVERMYARLEREAWAAARVAHRNVVTVYDVATEDGRPWIVMELVRGVSLADVLEAEGPLPPRRAAHVGAEVLAALRAAHAAGVLHRDVKPGNVLMANDGRVVLTDFGIATVEGDSALTLTGEVVGSPEYVAPERALGRTPGPGSDLWSLGVLLYAAVEGVSPFRQDTPLSTLRAVVDEELPPPRRAGPLAPVLEGLLRKDPALRLSAEDAERDLSVIGAGVTPRPSASAAGGAGAVPPERQPDRSGPAGPVPASGAAAPDGAEAADGADRPGHPRRAVVVLIAGLAALALALAGLTYALVDRGDGGGGRGGGASTDGGGGAVGGADGGATGGGDGSGGGSDGGGGAGGTDGGGSPGGGGGGGGGTGGPGTADGSPTHGGGTGTAAPRSVEVTVEGAHTEYTGSCPVPPAQASAFTATLTVDRTPVDVDYRWVTRGGGPSDADWRTLSFASERTRQVRHVETAYEEGGTLADEIGVEVRGPVRTASDRVPFSVTCEEETPTDGTSSSASPGPGE
ncbi:serine/threonine-protein kinase [Streptomyces minutiscleroticus]|uniref:serine/threonine-protein kinase n=1 Tax=Streptomyces minutiscleroticus TaxID=68238 RepID=UPI00167E2DC7|nr:serine/threonine-protein kinase [Streptomyces minutiscleroticus]